MDMNELLQQAMQMQQQLSAAQQEVAATEVEGVSGGGAVRITMTGGGQFTDVRIDPACVDPADLEMLQDLVLAALHDATAKAAALGASAMERSGMGAMMQGFGGPDGMGGLGGLLGGR